MARKGRDWIDIFLQYNIDVPGKLIFLNEEIDNGTLDQIISGLHLIGPGKEVTLLINSVGGDLTAGFGIYDAISQYGGEVTGRVVGEACSAACILLQACDIREASPHATLMHHVGHGAYSEHAKNFQLFAEFYKRQLEQIDELMLNRINQTRQERGEAAKNMAWWRERNQWDRWLSPTDAIALGLLDRVYTGEG